MKAWIYDKDGRGWLLPDILSWDISHGFGSPCDSFQLSFLHDGEMADTLSNAVGFRAEYEGRTVFVGRVDEFILSADAHGSRARLLGRGLQALLLDNEAESADYYNADLNYILSRHVQEMGIEHIDCGLAAGRAALFSVESGMSHWGVLQEFTSLCCGVRPRFSPEGALLVDGERGGQSFVFDSGTGFISAEYREDRYGVISSVKVKKYSSGGSITEENREFLDKGGACHRVINVPKKTSYDSMRFTARYQMEKSMDNYRVLKLTLPWTFAAFPGDRLEVKDLPLGVSGHFLVVASRCQGDGSGGSTQLEMRRI